MCQTYASLSTLVRKMPLCSLIYKPEYSGLPRNLWKLPQTFGRAGRDKSLQAVAVQVFWPGQKGIYLENLYGASAACKYNFVLAGKSTPAGKVREIFLKQTCRREALNAAFTLSNVHSEDFLFLWILPEQISKYLHSGFYDADEDGQNVCLELLCAVGSLCRSSKCCFVLSGFHLPLQLPLNSS